MASVPASICLVVPHSGIASVVGTVYPKCSVRVYDAFTQGEGARSLSMTLGKARRHTRSVGSILGGRGLPSVNTLTSHGGGALFSRVGNVWMPLPRSCTCRTKPRLRCTDVYIDEHRQVVELATPLERFEACVPWKSSKNAFSLIT